jgi:YggT family protein
MQCQRCMKANFLPVARISSARISAGAHGANRRRCGFKAVPEVATLVLDAGQAGLLATVLKPTLTVVEICFILRIVMSWDPELNTDKKLPWAVFYKPTEPILAPTRKVIKPIGGVDISPIVWTFIISLLSEILLGPQGLLILIERQGGM